MFNVTAIQKAENQLKTYSQFFPKAQADVLKSLLASEESSYVCNLIDSIIQKIESMPSTYETEGQGENAFAILHYFGGACDFYITEKDIEDGQNQAFGLGYICFPELGYISLPELFKSPYIELDLHFTPSTRWEVKKRAFKKSGALI